MKVAIVHYHLSTGGVSTVIRAASRALDADWVPHVILVGAAADADLPCETVEGLGYLPDPSGMDATTLLDRLRDAAARGLGGQPDIWHFHNHSLGKNCLIAQVVDRLALGGERLLLQLHDLAEDGRPHNYPNIIGKDSLYPIAPRVHYAFINTRDRRLFVDAGLPELQAHYLPNPVPTVSQLPSPPAGPPLILYPTRAIRRKNIGEILLLSLLSPTGTRFAITLAPKDPAARAIHDSWQAQAQSLGLPVDFNVVDRLSANDAGDSAYEAWIARATHIITTSIAEGFGLNFLESATYGKPLIGRNLPHITSDHPSSVGTLYDRVLIPSGWFPEEKIRQELTRELTESHRLYGQPLSKGVIDATLEALRHHGGFDFGNLPEFFQLQVIEHVATRREEVMIESQGILQSAREWLAEAFSQPVGHPDLSDFSTSSYATNLSAIYAKLMEQPSAEILHLDPRAILQSYLTPGNFHFLLTRPPASNSGTSPLPIRAVIFDVYGTLLIAPPGGFKPDPAFDLILSSIIGSFGHTPPAEPTLAVHQLIRQHHQSSPHPHPEVDLRTIFRELLKTDADPTPMIQAIEDARLTCEPMPGAAETIRSLLARDIQLGILSNAQSNTLTVLDRLLGGVLPLFRPDLTILSYQHGVAKPSPELFQLLTERLAAVGISPGETLYVGNDPSQDVIPAKAAGFLTALFTGHPSSLRPGACDPDLQLQSLSEILTATSSYHTKP